MAGTTASRVRTQFSKVGGSRAFLVAQKVKNLTAMQETLVRSLGQEDALEKETATHSSILAWRIPGQRSLADYLPFMGSQRVRHD